jgi:hypothetical protein
MRFLMGLAAAAMFVSSVAFSAAPASAGPMMGSHMRCPHGKHWVAPYMRHGHWVKGYCRR